MARPKSYVREEALETLKAAFWQYGYQTLSIRSIEDITGIDRFVIRTEFGGKEGALLEAIDSYTAEMVHYVIEPLQQKQSLQAIIDFFERAVLPANDTLRRFGCLVTNTTVEQESLKSIEVKAKTDLHFSLLREGFHKVLVHEMEAGTLRDTLNIEDCVEFLTGAIIAMSVLSRQSQNVEAGKGYVAITVDTINQWRAA